MYSPSPTQFQLTPGFAVYARSGNPVRGGEPVSGIQAESGEERRAAGDAAGSEGLTKKEVGSARSGAGREENRPSGAKERDGELSEDEQRKLEQLRQRDREVKAHEAAHMAAAGGLARGGASFSYERGPDGVMYAVGGEVSIDTSGVPGDPEATLRKAEQIRAAALAPADPSAQDRQVAAEATRMAAEARAELASKRAGQGEEGEEATAGDTRRARAVEAYGAASAAGRDAPLDLFA